MIQAPSQAVRRVFAAAVVVSAVVWGAASLAYHFAAVVQRHARPDRNIRLVSRWLPGTRQVERLRTFLLEVDRILPKGEPFVFVGAQTSPTPQLHEYLWASYLLPARDVISPSSQGHPGVDYVVTYRDSGQPRRGLVVVASLADGTIYRPLE
jgi:hypothetical protein